jgi:hypothetical protein
MFKTHYMFHSEHTVEWHMLDDADCNVVLGLSPRHADNQIATSVQRRGMPQYTPSSAYQRCEPRRYPPVTESKKLFSVVRVLCIRHRYCA